jgi:hypothetical protein
MAGWGIEFGDEFGGALSDDFATCGSAFGSEVDDPIAAGDKIELVFDDENGVSFLDEFLEEFCEAFYVSEV